MSLDASYLLIYDVLHYIDPTPMDRDIKYLEDNFGGYFIKMTSYDIYWSKPKYTLTREHISNLAADQVLERLDFEVWRIIK